MQNPDELWGGRSEQWSCKAESFWQVEPAENLDLTSTAAMADAPPVVTEAVGEAAPQVDEAAVDPASAASVDAEPAGTKRKFDEAADGPEAEEERLHKRVVLEPEAGATTSAEVRPLCT